MPLAATSGFSVRYAVRSNPSGSSPRTDLIPDSDVAASVIDPTTEPAGVTGEVDSLALRRRDMRRNGLVIRQLAEPSSAAISWSRWTSRRSSSASCRSFKVGDPIVARFPRNGGNGVIDDTIAQLVFVRRVAISCTEDDDVVRFCRTVSGQVDGIGGHEGVNLALICRTL